MLCASRCLSDFSVEGGRAELGSVSLCDDVSRLDCAGHCHFGALCSSRRGAQSAPRSLPWHAPALKFGPMGYREPRTGPFEAPVPKVPRSPMHELPRCSFRTSPRALPGGRRAEPVGRSVARLSAQPIDYAPEPPSWCAPALGLAPHAPAGHDSGRLEREALLILPVRRDPSRVATVRSCDACQRVRVVLSANEPHAGAGLTAHARRALRADGARARPKLAGRCTPAARIDEISAKRAHLEVGSGHRLSWAPTAAS